MAGFKQFVPHSILDRHFWDSVRRNAAFVALLADNERIAGQADLRPAPPLATDFLAAKRVNDREILDNWWHDGRITLAALAIRRLLLGVDPDDPDDALLNTLWVHVTQSTWAVSAHLPGCDLPASDDVCIDLAAAEMAANLAEICETLRPWMESVSSTLFSRTIHEIDRRVLEPFGGGPPIWWERGDSNWSGVCAGSILLACQSFEAMGMPRPAAKARAMVVLGRYLNEAFTPSGECDEGVGYWSYGIGCAMKGWMRLTPDEYLHEIDHERLRAIADYPRRAHLYGSVFYTGNDSDMRNSCPLWLAEAVAEYEEADWYRTWAAGGMLRGGDTFSRVLRTLNVTHPRGIERASAGPAAAYLPDQQVAILRTNTPRGEMIGILGGGHNAERHNHNDIGQLLFILDRHVIVTDLGNQRYTADFFGPNRYSYLAASSRGHNCPIVAGEYQRAGREAAATVEEWDAEQGRFSLEAAAAYPQSAGLLRWNRILERSAEGDTPGFLVTDRFLTAEPGRSVVSRIWSTQPIDGSTGELFHIGPLDMRVSPPCPAWTVTLYDGSHELLRSYAGRTLYCLDLSYETAGDGNLEIVMRLFAGEP